MGFNSSPEFIIIVPRYIYIQMKQFFERKLTENVFVAILFPCGSASFVKDRILFTTLANYSRDLDSQTCESLLGLQKKFSVGCPWPAAMKALSLISFQKIG